MIKQSFMSHMSGTNFTTMIMTVKGEVFSGKTYVLGWTKVGEGRVRPTFKEESVQAK